jgi:hypothetical protein
MAAIIAPGGAGAPPAPTVCTVAAPITPDSPVILDASEPLVIATAFLTWSSVAAAGAAPARASLPTWAMVKYFLCRCRFSQALADQTTFLALSPLQFRLTGAFWGRLLTELVASGLLSVSMTTAAELARAVRGLPISNLALVTIFGADITPGEPFDTPARAAVAGRARARGRAAVAAVPGAPRVPGPPPLLFLNMTNITMFEDLSREDSLSTLALLVGTLGPCLTRASRLSPASAAQLAAAAIAPNLQRFRGLPLGVANDALMASQLHDLLLAVGETLHGVYESVQLTPGALLSELMDMLRYVNGTALERQGIEARRLLCASFKVRHPHPHALADASRVPICPARAPCATTWLPARAPGPSRPQSI